MLNDAKKADVVKKTETAAKTDDREKGKPKKSLSGGIVAKIKSVKHLDMIIAAVVVIIMMLIYFSSFASCSESSGSAAPSSGSSASKDYCTAVVEQLEKNLSEVSGAGKVSVLINWATSEEQIPATSTNSAGGSSIVTVGGQVYILKIVYPTPKGVLIICDGANNIATKLSLISAVSSYFGISENTITVLARSSGK